jgi:hypothetical protein
MNIRPGYWRSSQFSDKILFCYNLKENCPGSEKTGHSYGDGLCFEGHVGALCESCDIERKYWRDSYANRYYF